MSIKYNTMHNNNHNNNNDNTEGNERIKREKTNTIFSHMESLIFNRVYLPLFQFCHLTCDVSLSGAKGNGRQAGHTDSLAHRCNDQHGWNGTL